MKSETFPLSAPAKVHHNTREVELIEEAIRRGEARFSAAGALVVETGAHTGRSVQDKFTVRDATTEKAVWWDNNKPMSPEQFELLWADFRAHAKSRELFVQDLYRRRRSRAPAQRPHLHRVRLARAVHPPPAAPADGRRARRLQARVHRHQPAELQGRPETLRRAQRDRHRLQLRQAAGADRRHVLRRRDQEVGLHLPQLRHAREGRDAHALLGQRRSRRRCGDLLRAVRHRQDDAVGRSQAHAAGRRRARLVRGRHLQFRGRLLRQDHPPVAGGRARDLGRHQPLRRGAGERHPRSGHARARLRRRPADREHPLRLSARVHLQRQRDAAPPAIPRTSSC